MTFEELRNPTDDPWSVNALGFELLHNVKEIIVHLGLAAKLQFHLIKIRKCILHLQSLKLLPLSRCSWRC